MMGSSVRKEHCLEIFRSAVDAVHPSKIIPGVLRLNEGRLQVGEDLLPFTRFNNIYVAGAGKATAAMASEVEKILTHHVREGVIAVRDGLNFPLKYVRAIEAGHPLPDRNSVIAAEEIVKVLSKLKENDLLLFLLSGGASSLMMDVPYGCTLEEVNVIMDQLLKSGATIHEINTVRKHLSELKGGQLVKKCSSATVISFIISDVIGSDLQVIGSGPTVGDETSYSDAMHILEKYDIRKNAPYSIIAHLQKGIDESIPPNPKTGDPIFKNTRNNIIADNKKALHAAYDKATELGYEAHIITDSLCGNAEETAAEWVSSARSYGKNTCLIAGGETTVKVKGTGKGGRNQHFALAAAIALKNSSDITLLAAGTDGSDGPTDAAGAIADCNTYLEARNMGRSAEEFLQNNDSYHFFEAINGLVKTGPTNTNVMDVIVMIGGPEKNIT